MTKLGAGSRQFGAAQLHWSAVAEAIVAITDAGGEHAGVTFVRAWLAMLREKPGISMRLPAVMRQSDHEPC